MEIIIDGIDHSYTIIRIYDDDSRYFFFLLPFFFFSSKRNAVEKECKQAISSKFLSRNTRNSSSIHEVIKLKDYDGF